MASSFTDMIIGGAQVPSADDRRVRDVVFPHTKRALPSAQAMADGLLNEMSGKRFRGASALAPMFGALPASLVDGMRVINSGLSTNDAQTDEIITQCIFAKPYPQHWEQGFVEKTALFCNRVEPDRSTKGVYTVADVPILNFSLELAQMTRTRNALLHGGGANDLDELSDLASRFEYMLAGTADEFMEKWNLLGAMTTFQDASVYSSNADVRRANGGQRMLGFSVFNRAWTFNLFSPNVRIGERLYFVVKEVDISHLRNLVDPLGRSVVARTVFPARALQITGMTQSDMAFVPYDTSYQGAGDGLAAGDPAESDRNYVHRQMRCAYDYRRAEYDATTDTLKIYTVDMEPENVRRNLQELLDEQPQIVYDAYMEGRVMSVGYARRLDGRAPSASAIFEGHRSQDKMKLLQTVEIWNI